MFRKIIFKASWMALLGVATSTVVLADSSEVQASRLFRRLAGVPILPSDPRLKTMAGLIRSGRIEDAAAIATEDSNFYQVTVKNLAAKISSRNETPFVELDDFQATFIGTVMDDLDARLLLSGNYLYRSKPDALMSTDPSRRNNTHYEQIDKAHLEYQSNLVKQEPQWVGKESMRNHAGVMTTRGWGWNYDAGTNRRAVLCSFDRFLCKPIGSWKVPGLNEGAVARDVDRKPGGNPTIFLW